MFRDTKEELRRIEEELLAAEREESEMARADRLLAEFLAEDDGCGENYEEDFMQDYPAGLVAGSGIYRNFSNNYGQTPNYGQAQNYGQPQNYRRPQTPPPVYNTDWTDEDLDEYSDEVYEEPKEDLRGWVVLAMALLAGILAVMAFWAVRYL